MLTPREYAFTTPAIAKAIGLPAGDWGVLMCVDEDGGHWTVIGDADYVRMVRDAPKDETAGQMLDNDQLPITRKGWPPNWD